MASNAPDAIRLFPTRLIPNSRATCALLLQTLRRDEENICSMARIGDGCLFVKCVEVLQPTTTNAPKAPFTDDSPADQVGAFLPVKRLIYNLFVQLFSGAMLAHRHGQTREWPSISVSTHVRTSTSPLPHFTMKFVDILTQPNHEKEPHQHLWEKSFTRYTFCHRGEAQSQFSVCRDT